MLRRGVLSRNVLGSARIIGGMQCRKLSFQAQSPTNRILKIITRTAQIATVVLVLSALFRKKVKITTEYTGERNEEGKKHGRGILKYSNGARYDGEWKNGVMEGLGTFHYKNGDVYTGGFVNNKPHGRGLMMYKNENIYDGEWIDGKRTGDGTLTFANGSVYLGNWKDGVPVDAPDNSMNEIVVIEEGVTPPPVEPKINDVYKPEKVFVSDFGSAPVEPQISDTYTPGKTKMNDVYKPEKVFVSDFGTAPVEPKINDSYKPEKPFVSDFGFPSESSKPSSLYPDSAFNYSSSDDRKD